MAGIDDVTLTSPSNANVGIKKAYISCSCSTLEVPTEEVISDTLKYTYGGLLQYTWKFYINDTLKTTKEKTSRTITYTPTTLTAGAKHKIYAKVQGYCSRYKKERTKTVVDGKEVFSSWSTTDTKSVAIGDAETSNTITIYTRPGQFSSVDNNFMNIKQGETIQASTGLTAKSVEAWCTHCGKHLSWRDKTDRYNAANSCKVSSKDLITAKWYNSCAELCGLIDVEKEKTMRKTNKDYNDPNRVFAGKTLITAEIIKKLGTQISTKEIT